MTKAGKIKFGLSVPLIGGMAVANQKATGEDPSFIVSYDAFKDNDAHCVNRFPSAKYLIADGETNELGSDVDFGLFEETDFISTVCPCAGLSMLNSNQNGSTKARGADAVQNDWMYKSARLVLENVKPKVLWGENAPGLYTAMGDKVVENLRAIGKEHGYAMSLIKTDTFLHGIPQHRQRSFYFFWKGNEAPILNYYKRETPLLEDYLALVPEDASYMDVPFGIGKTSENGWFQFAASKGWTPRKLIESPYNTICQWIWNEKLVDECLQWAIDNDNAGMKKFLSHIKVKALDNKGWWDCTPLIFREATNAIIGKNAQVTHPTKERGITLREAMWLMGLPHDFEMVGGVWNHICQNVPVSTAADWTHEVMRFVKGEITEFGGSFVKQNNISQRIDHSEKRPQKKLF